MNSEQAQLGTGADELLAVLRSLGVDARRGQDTWDLVLPGGHPVEVTEASRPNRELIERLVRSTLSPGYGVLVADRLGRSQRQLLDEAGWGWLDRSGHLRLVVGGVAIDRDIESLLGPDPTPPDPLGRPSGLSVALTLLREPGRERSIRELAEEARLSVGATSQAVSGLEEAGMLDRKRRPVVPELFWETAARWAVRWFGLAEHPHPNADPSVRSLLQMNLDAEQQPGWAAVGAAAAQALGVRIVASSESPRIYVPTQRALTWALRTWGEASAGIEGPARLAVPPIELATRDRLFDRQHLNYRDPWPLASPLVIAITFAADADPRSREVLEGWDPPQELGQPRVW